MKKNKERILHCFIIFFFLIISSCRLKFDFISEKDVSDQIVEDIHSKKIIFLGDEHNWAFPPIFIAENLEKFYKAGIRYIFLEEKSGYYLKKNEEYNSFIYPPWGTWGYKQEYHILIDKIIQLNKIYKDDPLTVVWPEENIAITDEEFAVGNNLVMNKRDSEIQKVIIDIMDNTDSKGLIFYGSAHGLKKPIDLDYDSDTLWKMTGYYLDQYYKSDFSTYRLLTFHSDKKVKVRYSNKNDFKSISGKNLKDFLEYNNAKQEFDHYCLCQNYTFAVPEFYVPEERNLKYQFFIFTNSKISDQKKIDVWSDKSEQLLAVYYLKYHLGDKFDFDWNMPTEKLYQALENIDDKDLQNHTYNLTNLENYISRLYSGIENYLHYYPESLDDIDNDLKYFISDMSYAQKLNSRDIWPQYWTAYLQTDKASVSKKKNDYKIALQSWEKLLKNDLFYASPIIKIAYQKMSLCAEKTGDLEKSILYQNEAKNVSSILDIDFENYGYFGW